MQRTRNTQRSCIDANTGKTLFSSNADAPRYPASLTKMMTLYLTFEALRAAGSRRRTKVPFSKNAAAEPPTKLGVRAGGSVTVETAILSLVTKSANDAATALGELLAGSEEEFARMMTAKARKLGMTGTIFRNAHGLPNAAQRSTARDMAILGIALKEHFPQYYSYFSTRSFKYGKQRLGNHNRLLGQRQGRRRHQDRLYPRFGLQPRLVGLRRQPPHRRRRHGRHQRRRARQAHGRADQEIHAEGFGQARAAATLWPRPAIRRSRRSPRRSCRRRTRRSRKLRPEEEVAVATEDDGGRRRAAAGARKSVPADPEPVVVEQAYAEPIPARMADIDPVNTASVRRRPAGRSRSPPRRAKSKPAPSSPRPTSRPPTVLADASGYTVTFDKDGVTYYRARFGGFGSKNAAWNACNALKKKKIACYAVEQ